MNKNNILKSTFEVIKKEESKALKEEIGQSMADAYNNMGTLLSSDFSSKINKIWHKHINEIANKVINKLKSEQLNKYITTDNKFFISEIDECIDDVFKIISSMILKTRISEQELNNEIIRKNEKSKTIREDIIRQWNSEAEIINTKKPNLIQNLLENKIVIGIISFIGVVLSTIVATIILNKIGLK